MKLVKLVGKITSHPNVYKFTEEIHLTVQVKLFS